MSTVYVRIIVDVEEALSTQSNGVITKGLYMVDTNNYVGSIGEGTNELQTACKNLDKIVWSVSSINPGNSISIDSFHGVMIKDQVCVPQKDNLNGSWEGTIQTQGATGTYQYNCNLKMEGEILTFDPFLVVS